MPELQRCKALRRQCNARKRRYDWQSFNEQPGKTSDKGNDLVLLGKFSSRLVYPKGFPSNNTTKLALRKLGTYNKQDEAIKHCLAMAKKKIKKN